MNTSLPVNTDVERLLLGSTMMYAGQMDLIRSAVEEDDFSLESHRKIWRTVCKLYDAGEQVDQIIVHAALMDSGESQATGGLSYLVSLNDGIPEVPSLDGYVRILKDKTLRRRIIYAAQNMMNRAMSDDTPVDDLLTSFGEIETQLATSREDNKPVSTLELVKTIGVDSLLSPRRHGEIRIPWKRLDAVLSGFSGGQIIVLLGETSKGKTSFALQVAANVAQHGKAVLMWTMEMSPRSLFRRLVVQLSGVPVTGNAAQMSFEERDRHRMAVACLTEHPIYFDRHSRSVAQFGASIRQVRSKSKLGLVIVDYLQLIRSNSKQNRAQQVSENSRNLKLAAVDLDLPMLVLSQVDRASVKGDGKIGLHSGKEAGDIENDADVLLWIDSKKQLSRDEPTPVELTVGKQREGPAGFSIPMVFRPLSQTFLEVSDED